MKGLATRLVVALALLILALAGLARAPYGGPAEIPLADLPPEAIHTMRLIHLGGPFPYRKDGSVFHNRESRLPPRASAYYLEYTVSTPRSRDRGARRIVAGRGASGDTRSSGEYYYSPDHYRSFLRIRE